MATLLYSAAVSLDGFIAGPGGDMSWLTEHVGDPNLAADRVLAATGALLIGRTTYGGDDPNAGTDSEGAFGGRYDGPSVVLTHRPLPDPPPGVTVAGDLDSAVTLARAAAGDRSVNVLGADVAAQCLEAGYLDEVVMFVVPVLLGSGVRMFGHRAGPPVRLTPVPAEGALWFRIDL